MCELEADIAKANNGAQGSARQFKEEYIMVVQHNLTAMNSNRMLGITTKSQAKSTEKLSSGYKINRAADDAAGFSISEKMRKQIRGLTQASSNAQDGISAVQTAEGALTEVHDMLQRMNELAVKAANGTNSTDDRQYIQDEVDQLVEEIDRVSTTTKFNETYLLKGDSTATTNKTLKAKSAGFEGTWSGQGTGTATFTMKALEVGDKVTVAGTKYGVAAADEAAALKAAGIDTNNLNKGETIEINGTTYTIDDAADPKTNKITKDQVAGKVTADKINTINGKEYAVGTVDGYDTADKLYKKIGNEIAKASSIGTDADHPATVTNADNVFTVTEGTVVVNKAVSLDLHVGADSYTSNKISMDIDAMSAKGLGINGIQVGGDNGQNGTYAVDSIKEAIQMVSTQRSALGAIQNRLEHTINNLDNVVENTTSAESQIRDTDMATEMVKYSNNNILAQAGQAMLAQSNQSNQGVLSLLQ